MSDIELFEHTYIDNGAERTLFLLHGTGGGKEDFLFLDKHLKQKYNLVGVLGNEDEHGMRRFFKRKGFGVFDQENIKLESEKLSRFVQEWRGERYFLGYSNGANILLACLFYYPDVFKKLVLLHPMLPFKPEVRELSDVEIFLSMGIYDEMIVKEERDAVLKMLKKLKVKMILKEYEGGHEVSEQELRDVVEYLN
jgi:phospholipase/carboxylesterase